jgi:hypothetical protein
MTTERLINREKDQGAQRGAGLNPDIVKDEILFGAIDRLRSKSMG